MYLTCGKSFFVCFFCSFRRKQHVPLKKGIVVISSFSCERRNLANVIQQSKQKKVSASLHCTCFVEMSVYSEKYYAFLNSATLCFYGKRHLSSMKEKEPEIFFLKKET